MRAFVRAVAASGRQLRGTVLLDLSGGLYAGDINFTQLVRGIGAPMLTPCCGESYDPRATYAPGALRPGAVLRRGVCASSIPVADFDFLRTRGYVELTARVDNASARWPWHKKRRQVRWRGSSSGFIHNEFPLPDERFSQRLALALRGRAARDAHKASGAGGDGPGLDVGISRWVHLSERVRREAGGLRLYMPHYTEEEMIEARGIIDIDGYNNAWSGAWWKLRSNSVVLKVESPSAQWYYDLLAPWVHYVPVAPDLSDLDERVRWVLDPANDGKCIAIADAATKAISNITVESEVERTRMVLQEAFSNRHPPGHLV